MDAEKRIRNWSARRVAQCVSEVVSDPMPGTRLAEKLAHQRWVLMVGCCWEIPAIRPSFPEIGSVVGISHATARGHLSEWHSWPWRDRYSWLQLVEGRLALNETDALDADVRG